MLRTRLARDEIIGALTALSATDDLILKTQGHGACIHNILSAELGPYDASRVLIAGPDILLAPKLALTMALLTHELATDAAKHGALSCGTGQLSICWSLTGERPTLEWRECDGPAVATPLGMLLLSRALDQFGGAVETTFEPTGLICKLSVALAEDSPSIAAHEIREAAE